MNDHVLVPVDGSPAARRALEFASERFPDATVTLLYVANPMVDYSRRQSYPGYTGDDEFKNEREKGERVLDDALELVPAGVSVTTELATGEPARTIVRYVETHDVTHVIIGSHGREGVARFLLGSVAETVVRRSPVPVTVVRSKG